ncbi:hypothetical protein GCM10010218_45160 [Streptomyces mashuensis]|uniref:DUF6545 domain-containing protein n=1 Tax=Streptomyces mashuensis TaxID=33904 RepID=A0A919B7E7_9ACTN|nr:MAB_1171c family putative transporter [Streptomyces mashuensis]GHF58793.1 hypothetical protein GCM10010218_45160 [Streptomyces mashuensis]
MNTLYDILAYLCAAAGLTAFLYKLPALARQPRDPALYALCTYFLGSAVSFLIDLNQIRDDVAEFLDFPNVTTVITQGAVVVLTAAQQVVLIHWSHAPGESGPRAGRRILGFAAALAVLLAFFFLIAPPRRVTSAEETLLLNMHNPRYAVYLCFYLGICAVGQVATVRLSYRYAHFSPCGWLRVGMWSVTAGAALILLYCSIRYIEIAGTHLGFDMSHWEYAYWLAGDLGSLLQIFGWTVPSWGHRLPALTRWVVNYQSYLRLRPLWWPLYRATPDIALDEPRRERLDWLPPRDLEYRLYRRVIEIRDGQLALRPYFPSPGGPGDDGRDRAPAVREALLLHRALCSRKRDGVPPVGDPADVRLPAPPQGDIAKEISWLTAVATAFARITADEARQRPAEPVAGGGRP